METKTTKGVNTWLTGWEQNGVWRPRFRILQLKLQRTRAQLEYVLQWWLPSPLHDHGTQHTVTAARESTCQILLPTSPVSPHTLLGVHVYTMHQNGRHQTVQTRIGTGRIALKELNHSFVLQVLTETGAHATDLALTLDADASWLRFNANAPVPEPTEKHTALDRHWYTLRKPSTPLIEDQFRRRIVDTYLQQPVSVFAWQCLPGEVHTAPAFYENALQFALWLCGVDEPDGPVLAQVIGFFPWACRYATDVALDQADWKDTEQFAMIRDHPAEQERSGDCEDLAREMYLAYYWLCNSPRAPKALQALARSYTFYFVDAVVTVDRVNGLHQYAKLVPRATNGTVLFLESTEHTIQAGDNVDYTTVIARELLKRRPEWPRQVRLLHTPKTLVDDLKFHQVDLLYFADALEPKVPRAAGDSKFGISPLVLNSSAMDLSESTKLDAELVTQADLQAEVAIVPPLSSPPTPTTWLSQLPPKNRFHSFLKLHHALTDPQVPGIFEQLWAQLSKVADLVVWIKKTKKYTKSTGPCPKTEDCLVEIPVTAKQSFCILCLGWVKPL